MTTTWLVTVWTTSGGWMQQAYDNEAAAEQAIGRINTLGLKVDLTEWDEIGLIEDD